VKRVLFVLAVVFELWMLWELREVLWLFAQFFLLWAADVWKGLT